MATHNSRRQRGKREATFLESVREALVNLITEVTDIKAVIKGFHVPCTFGAPFVTQEWEPLDSWNCYGVYDDVLSRQVDSVISYLNPDAQPFIPSISRKTLLEYRIAFAAKLGSGKTPGETLVPLTVDSATLGENDVRGRAAKLWGRRRPSARVRRKKRNQQALQLASAVQESLVEIDVHGNAEHMQVHTQDNWPELPFELEAWEMLLPCMTATSFNRTRSGSWCFYDGSSSWPTKINRDTFAFLLPASPGLLEVIDANLFTGSAYRDEAPIPMDPRSSGWSELREDEENGVWQPEEIQVWMRVTARLANQAAIAADRQNMNVDQCLKIRMNKIRERWEEARSKIPLSIQNQIWEILSEPPDIKYPKK